MILFTWITPVSVGWRDSGEFILTSFFLDIPHPAGFPTYSMLSNAASLLLPGPIAWRTHLFSILCLLGAVYQGVQITVKVTKNYYSSLAYLPFLLILFSESAMRAASTAEVYALTALLLFSILRLLITYNESRDARYIYTAGFLGGLAIGNHVFAAAVGIWFALVLVVSRKATVKVLRTGSLFLVLGTLVYLYLPARSIAHPPLNTGNPNTLSRFFNQISDARDRYLRPAASPSSSEQSSAFSLIGKDIARINNEVSWPVTLLAVLGILAALRGNSSMKLLLACNTGIVALTLLFFAGWDSDPWISAILSVGILGSVGMAYISTVSPQVALVVTFTATIFGLKQSMPSFIERAGTQSDISTAKEIGEELLKSVPQNGVLITEPTWFIVRYLQSVEGLRKDVTALYQPSILFPHYFAPINILLNGAALTLPNRAAHNEADLSNFFTLIKMMSDVATIQIEPQEILVTPLREVLKFSNDGHTRIIKNIPGSLSKEFISVRIASIQKLLNYSHFYTGTLHSDIENYAVIIFRQTFEALQVAHGIEAACRFGRGLEFSGSSDERVKKFLEGQCLS